MKLHSISALIGLGRILLSTGEALAQNCSQLTGWAEAVASYKSGNSKLARDKDGTPGEKPC